MKRTRANELHQDAHGHFAPEELLEIALEQNSGRVQTDAASAHAHARVRACAHCSQVLDGLLHDLAGVQSALRGFPAIDEQRTATLAEATIAMTTREDLSWRGDGRAFWRLLQRGWKSSVALRIVVACLLFHVVALPVAVIALSVQARREQPDIVANAASAAVPASVARSSEPRNERVIAADSLVSTSVADAVEAPARSQRAALARRDLLENGAAKLSAFERQLGCSDELTQSIARTLIARSRPLGMGHLDGGSKLQRSEDSALVERARCAERLLSNWVASGRVDRRLSASLWQVSEQAASDPASPSSGMVLTRVDGSGLELAGAAGELGPGAGPERELFKALEQACASKLASEPAGELANWVAWGRGSER